jgi:hypothetical protein
MATMRVEEILRDTRAFVEAKTASEKRALAGQDPNTLPGSEHDQKVKEESKKPTPQVTEGSPAGAFSASGAKPGDVTEMGHTLQAGDPPPAKVDKEPLITSDVNAAPKTGAALLANDLLASIKKAQDELQKTAAKDDKKPAGSKGGDVSEAQAVDASKAPPPVKKEGPEPAKQDMPSDAKEAPAKDKAMAEHGGSMPSKGGSAGPSALELTQDVLAKIASTLLATEEGWNVVHDGLSKAAGAEAAHQTMAFLKQAAEQIQAEQAFAQGYNDADNLIKQAIYQQGVADAQKQAAAKQPAAKKTAAASPEQAQYDAGYKAATALLAKASQPKQASAGVNTQLIQKLAKAIAEASVKQAEPGDEEEAGADAGGEEAGADMAGDEAGAGEEAGADAGPLGEMAAAPQDEEISPEDLQQALAALVQDGQLDPQLAAQIMQYVGSADSVGQAAGEAAAPEAVAPEGMPAGAAEAAGPGAAMEATASAVPEAASLLAAIEKIRQAKK